MKYSFPIVISLIVLVLLPTLTFGIHVVPVADVNLDNPPETRWQDALNAILTNYTWSQSFGPVFSTDAWVFNQLPSGAQTKIAQAVQKYYPEYYAELSGLQQGFVKYGHPEVTLEYLCAWAYFHELAHANFSATASDSQTESQETLTTECTGTLAADSNGFVYHGRNMDQVPSAVRQVTAHIRFIKNGQVIAEGIDYYWFNVGVMTGYKAGVASVSENWRGDQKDIDGNYILSKIYNGTMSQVWFYREALVNQNWTYSQILNYLQTCDVIVPLYNILAGAGYYEGAIISRDQTKVLPLYQLNSSSSDGWYLVQTNSDQWSKTPDSRRSKGLQLFSQLGQRRAATSYGTFAIITTYPIHNSATFITSVFSASYQVAQFYGQEGIDQV